MAGAGWLLCKDSIFGIWATFEPRDPGDTRPVRYRLDPAGEATGWIFGSSRPDGEKAEGYREMGWEYVTFHGEFYLYRTFDPEAVELNTDPAVQALALKKVGSQMKGQLFSLIFWLVIYPLAGLGGFLLTAALLLGTPFFAVFTSPSSSRFTATCGALSTCGRCGGSSGRANPSRLLSGRGGKSAATGRSGRPTCC